MVAARLHDMHDVSTLAADCRARYGLVATAFDALDAKGREKQLSVRASSGSARALA
jgi:hypothetical protein